MRRIADPRLRGSIAAITAVALVVLASLAMAGCACKPLDEPTMESGGVAATGTVQAELPVETTVTPETTTGPAAVETTTPKPVVPTIWPTKVGTFAKSFKKGAWYPKYLPKGYKVDTIDIVEMGTKTGLVCDVVYLSGEKALIFTQGSPTERSYDVISAGKVPWGSGSEQADIMYQDPEDPESPPMIIFTKSGTFIELQGDPSLDELKKIAASMVPVK
jgi:hypothetical protein